MNSASFSGILDQTGEFRLGIADMKVLEELSFEDVK